MVLFLFLDSGSYSFGPTSNLLIWAAVWNRTKSKEGEALLWAKVKGTIHSWIGVWAAAEIQVVAFLTAHTSDVQKVGCRSHSVSRYERERFGPGKPFSASDIAPKVASS